MSENEDQSPFGRGFVAACIVIGAILLCGAVLIIAGPTSPAASGASGTAGSGRAGSSGDPGAAGPGGPASAMSSDGSGTDGSGGDLADHPAGPDGSASVGPRAKATAGTASACGLPDGEQAIPLKAPAADGWDVSRRVVVPRSAAYGPAKVDPDGFRRCFAHSPAGAVYAAYSAVAAIADQHQTIATIPKLMLPGPDAEALLREVRKQTPDGSSAPTQVAGYRVLDASGDRATVVLAMPVESAYMSATFTLVWHDGDWRLVPPTPGEPVGAPYAQQRDLADFVAWSGV
jgi:hypothetical protein